MSKYKWTPARKLSAAYLWTLAGGLGILGLIYMLSLPNGWVFLLLLLAVAAVVAAGNTLVERDDDN